MSTITRDPAIQTNKLIRIIATGEGDGGVSKMRALAALRRTRSTRKEEIFSSLLADRRESPRFKHQAVMGLYEMGGRKAEQALLKNARNADEETAAAMAAALGRIGSAESLPVVTELGAASGPGGRGRASFAASLLAYRHDLPGHDVKAPGARQLLKLGADAEAQPIKVQAARANQAEEALASLKAEPIGLELTTAGARRIDCKPNSFIYLWNKRFLARGLQSFKQQKGVAGVMLRKNRLGEGFAFSWLVLTTPSRNGSQLTIHRSSGEIVLAGPLRFDRAGASFDLRSTKRPGAAGMEFSAKLNEAGFSVTAARSATTVQAKKKPARASSPPAPSDEG